MVLVSLGTAMSVGVINMASAFIAYHAFIPNKPAVTNEPLISSAPPPVVVQSSVPMPSPAPTTPSSKPPRPAVRKPGNAIVVGAAPQPAAVTTDSAGQTVYHWCSGTNPALADAVCEAVVSIAADPTASNPHLGDQVIKSLSLLPRDSTLSMDESSWNVTSATAGTMTVTLHTKTYGDVHLKVTIEKINDIWVVTDGQLT